MMKVVVLLTPWEGFRERLRLKQYIRTCIRDCIVREELPWGPQVMLAWTEALYEDDPEQRREGIELGKQMVRRSDSVALYIDLGVSAGMREIANYAAFHSKPVDKRRVYKEK